MLHTFQFGFTHCTALHCDINTQVNKLNANNSKIYYRNDIQTKGDYSMLLCLIQSQWFLLSYIYAIMTRIRIEEARLMGYNKVINLYLCFSQFYNEYYTYRFGFGLKGKVSFVITCCVGCGTMDNLDMTTLALSVRNM